MPSTPMLQSESRFTDKEPAPLDQGGQPRAAQHLAVLAQPLLEPQCLHLSQQILVALLEVFPHVRVEVHLVVHFLRSSFPSCSHTTMACPSKGYIVGTTYRATYLCSGRQRWVTTQFYVGVGIQKRRSSGQVVLQGKA